MIRTIARYGARHVPGTTWAVIREFLLGRSVRGPAIRLFEKKFAEYHGARHAISASYGRMAFYYILRALNLPTGSEIIFPALTFWVVPEIARVCGLRPVFADINANTYNLDARALARAITPSTRAVVPTHLYGQPCDMAPILELARQNNLVVIEDCAHSLGAAYQGEKTGTMGHAAFFSFQMLKGLNTYGGGMALTNDNSLAAEIRALADAEPWPSHKAVLSNLISGYLKRAFISPYGFTFSMFLAFYIASFFGHHDLTRFIWEKIRPLHPLPPSYRRRYSNLQAVIGLKVLEVIDSLNAYSQLHAHRLTEGLKQIRSIRSPEILYETIPVYYQYCIRSSRPEELSHRAIRRGIDLETMHVDICNKLDLFSAYATSCPVAEATAETLQLPVYSSLSTEDIERIIYVIQEIGRDLPPLSPNGGHAPSSMYHSRPAAGRQES
ncbi:MAG: DegT/DnrJ/EryC1/StrS aminotransferase family protein [Acidobacteria bacterium]|nr:DegT/DnrJ/EryC1/StrS aminotransferase family protein [Acidobacteriota bacterium]MBI3657379.1 DegT/DnrJ/EryC1/StrS aminotransferase family protein [Acidobacteriota bacterium]